MTMQGLWYFRRLVEWRTKWTDNERTLCYLTLYRWLSLKKFAEVRRNKKVVPQ